ncbi:CD209 antigen-like protein A [Eleutherodactylus coqui]|uniref:CD209 antigen-like protein A n=1 Tax=Eleutherodactylus coqui TaxID=57060 RepID=UPI0034620009
MSVRFKSSSQFCSSQAETIFRACPSGWKQIGLFCYYFSMDKLSWNESRDDCIIKGAGLLLLKTEEEKEALESSLETDRYWIGLKREKDSTDNWKWLDGSTMSFGNWKDGEPNNNNKKEDCAESQNGPWNDSSCTEKKKYVCKK